MAATVIAQRANRFNDPTDVDRPGRPGRRVAAPNRRERSQPSFEMPLMAVGPGPGISFG